MLFRVFNRYDQEEIISQLTDFTHQELKKNKYIPIYRILFTRILVSVLIVFGLIAAYHFKQYFFESKGPLIILVVIFIFCVSIDKKLSVKNGKLVGQYKYGNDLIKFQLTYVPMTTKCYLKKTNGQHVKETDFNYNEYINNSGYILQAQFKRFIKQFIGSSEDTSRISTEEI